jgi:hypothetical protein
MEKRIKKRLAGAAQSFARSETEVPFALKLRTAELVLRLMERRKKFGLFVILGWQKKWQDYLDVSDSAQDIFAKHHIDIMGLKSGARRRHDVGATVNFDGAILIDPHGVIIHSGVFIEGLRPRVVAQKINPGQFKDLSEQFGFDTKVHARHLSAITASYIFKGTTVFTVSEEDDSFHVFEHGTIVYRA